MQKRLITLILILTLAACNMPNRAVPTPTADPVGTQVSLMLTSMPTATEVAPSETPPPVQLPSDTPEQPTATSAPAATETALPTAAIATLTPTISASDPKSSLGAPAYQNTLESSRGLYLYESDNTRVTHEGGALQLSGLTADGWHGWTLFYSHPSQHLYLEGIFRTQNCAGSDLYGLVFRAIESDAGYFFGVTCDGRYNLHARDFRDGSDLRLIELTAHSAIRTGSNAENRLGVMASRDRIALYANGELLQQVNDSTYPEEGNFGAFVAANATAGFTVALDEIAVWDLPGY